MSVTEALQDEVTMLWSDEGRLATLSAALAAMADALDLDGTEAVEAALSAPGFNFAPALVGLDDRQAHRVLLELIRALAPGSLDAAGWARLEDPRLYDTAMMLLAQDSLGLMLDALGEASEQLLTLTEVHQQTATGLRLAQHLSAAVQGQAVLLATRAALPCQMPREPACASGLAEALGLQVPDLPWADDPWPLTDIAAALSGLCPLIAAYHGDAAQRLADAAAAIVLAAAQGQGGRAFSLDTEDALGRGFDASMAALVALNRALDRWQGPRVDEALQPEAWRMVDATLARARAVMEESSAG
ncbi:MAG: hypothetical protein VX077_01695, partial [Pseudomonadota bacterium]|nr:hypothetical protein [Pseudomonadota bacterium]